MAIASPQHDFKPAIKDDITIKKLGRVKLFWGLISYPKIKEIHKHTRLNFCRYCGEQAKTLTHGYYWLL